MSNLQNVESPTTSDIEFKRKECIAVTQTVQDCPSTAHTASDETSLATSYTQFLIVMPQVTILHCLLARKSYRFITLSGQLKSDFLSQISQWHVIDTRSQTVQALQ